MPRVADEIFELEASVLRTLASPRRLEILHRLGRGPLGVHQLAAELRASQPNTSAHLASLRGVGLVEAVREGRDVLYRLTDTRIVVACGMVREVMARRLVRLGTMVAAARHAGAVTIPRSPRRARSSENG